MLITGELKTADNDKPESRIIIFSDDVDQQTIKPVLERIYNINSEDDKLEAVMNENSFARESIELVLNSYGGSGHAMFAVISAMEGSETPIHTHVGGVVMSAGTKILMAGHHRTASPYATLMLHDGYDCLRGHSEDIKAQLIQSEIENKRVMEFIKSHSKLTDEFIEDMIKNRKDVYFTAEEALEAGIIDEIVMH